MRLAVNIDHIATLRNARNEKHPDPATAAAIAELSGASGIVCHLREDRRHIRDRDLERLREIVTTKLDLEMAMTEEMQEIAIRTRPELITLVPEKREELTTEGGFDIFSHYESLRSYIEPVQDAGIEVSIFLEPDKKAIELAAAAGAELVELHTGPYSRKKKTGEIEAEIKRLRDAAGFARELGLRVVAGHGLDYYNIIPFKTITEIEEVSIGHALIARASLTGMERAVKDLLQLLDARD